MNIRGYSQTPFYNKYVVPTLIGFSFFVLPILLVLIIVVLGMIYIPLLLVTVLMAATMVTMSYKIGSIIISHPK